MSDSNNNNNNKLAIVAGAADRQQQQESSGNGSGTNNFTINSFLQSIATSKTDVDDDKTIMIVKATKTKKDSAEDSSESQEEASSFGSGFDLQKFYLPFALKDITPQNQQKWPYYKYVSCHWDTYAQYGTTKITAASVGKKCSLKVAALDSEERLDLRSLMISGGDDGSKKSILDTLILDTQTKGFVVMRDNTILAEFYNNGFRCEQTNLLQSASKTYMAVVVHQLIDNGKLTAEATLKSVLPDFADHQVGNATIQQLLDHTSGMPQLLDFHTPGALGQIWETTIGLQQQQKEAGSAKRGHKELILSTSTNQPPGKVWQYSDMNTDLLGLVATKVSGKTLPDLLSDLWTEFGAHSDGSIAKTCDHTEASSSYSPCYGISTTARDYALFHQWIANGVAPKSYYRSVFGLASNDRIRYMSIKNRKESLFSKTNPLAADVFPGVEYGSQSYYLIGEKIIYSSGSYGQQGYSDCIPNEGGTAVVFLSDWAVNWEVDKGNIYRSIATTIINDLRVSKIASNLFQDPMERMKRRNQLS